MSGSMTRAPASTAGPAPGPASRASCSAAERCQKPPFALESASPTPFKPAGSVRPSAASATPEPPSSLTSGRSSPARRSKASAAFAAEEDDCADKYGSAARSVRSGGFEPSASCCAMNKSARSTARSASGSAPVPSCAGSLRPCRRRRRAALRSDLTRTTVSVGGGGCCAAALHITPAPRDCAVRVSTAYCRLAVAICDAWTHELACQQGAGARCIADDWHGKALCLSPVNIAVSRCYCDDHATTVIRRAQLINSVGAARGCFCRASQRFDSSRFNEQSPLPSEVRPVLCNSMISWCVHCVSVRRATAQAGG